MEKFLFLFLVTFSGVGMVQRGCLGSALDLNGIFVVGKKGEGSTRVDTEGQSAFSGGAFENGECGLAAGLDGRLDGVRGSLLAVAARFGDEEERGLLQLEQRRICVWKHVFAEEQFKVLRAARFGEELLDPAL